jgi:hypothetical protein
MVSSSSAPTDRLINRVQVCPGQAQRPFSRKIAPVCATRGKCRIARSLIFRMKLLRGVGRKAIQ